MPFICPFYTQWKEGCSGGESPEDMSARVDEVVEYVRNIHRQWMNRPHAQEGDEGGDVLIISHGHFSRVSGQDVATKKAC